MNGKLTDAQIKRAMNPVRPDRIEAVRGLSYVPAEEVRAELIRQFGPGNWDSEVVDCVNIYEYEGKNNAGKANWFVAYRVGVRLNVRDYEGNPVASFVEYHVEENNQPQRGEAHANAVTAASSYALRRCAIGLGDNYGLHLYHKGSQEPLVKGTLMLQGDKDSPRAVRPPETTEPPEANAVPVAAETPVAPNVAATVAGAFAQ